MYELKLFKNIIMSKCRKSYTKRCANQIIIAPTNPLDIDKLPHNQRPKFSTKLPLQFTAKFLMPFCHIRPNYQMTCPVCFSFRYRFEKRNKPPTTTV